MRDTRCVCGQSPVALQELLQLLRENRYDTVWETPGYVLSFVLPVRV